MFLTYVIKVDIRELVRLYFKHTHVLLLFLVFPEKLPLCSQCVNMAHIHHLTPWIRPI